jgi:hypothetical protein
MTVAERIVEKHERYGWSEPEGEWGLIQEESRREMHAALSDGDVKHLDFMLNKMFGCSVTAGLISRDFSGVDVNWGYAPAVEKNITVWARYLHPHCELTNLETPDIGTPPKAEVAGIKAMIDTPRHDRYAAWLSNLTPDNGHVLIIGGGYGGTVRQLLHRRPDVWVTVIDLPETLYLAWYWLDGCGLDVDWWGHRPRAETVREWMDGDDVRVELLPVQDLDDGWPQCVDVIFGAHCFSEMPHDVVADYMSRIRDSGARYFAHSSAHAIDIRVVAETKNDHESRVMFPETPSDLINPGPPYRELMRAPAPFWQNSGSRYWEFLYTCEDV